MDTNYLWPLSLRMPKRPPKIVYLDMNHWITLAKVMFGRCDGVKDKKLLQFCLDSVDRQVAVYPISVSIFTEILKIRDHQKRQNLRKVIERLSQFMVVTNRAVVAAHEIECFLDQAVGPNPAPINRMDYLDWGVFRAIGKDGSIKVMSASGEDITAGFRQSYTEGPEAFDRIVFEASLELNRQILDGPAPEDEASLRKQGYNPEAILNDYKNEAKSEEELARRLDNEQRWRRGRLRDLVSAREVAFQINSILKRGCHERGIDSLGSLFASINEPRNAFDSMPSFDASGVIVNSGVWPHSQAACWCC